ncbi:MAG: hypothetical protein Q8L35_05680 [Actinomycetota bacterium]|nr:hypothetical protein [Actinomycetota bacterium]
MTFVVSLVFVFIFYVVPLYAIIAKNILIFPVLGHDGSWLLTAAVIYVLMALAALTLKQFEEMLAPGLPRWREELTHRAGIYRLDSFGFRLSLLATVLFLGTDPKLVPLGVASVIGFGSLNRKKVVPRAVKRAAKVDRPVRGEPAPEEGREAPVARRFAWQMREGLDQPYDGEIELTIDRRIYEESAAANPYSQGRPATRNYSQLVGDGITAELQVLVDHFRDISEEQAFSSYQELACVLAFVQAIPYADDSETKGREYIRWPIETLYDNVGDSDCKSVLLATLLRALDYEVIIIEAKGRTAVGIGGAEGLPGRFLTHKGERYYYCETSTMGWRVGQLPPDLADGQFRVYPIS